MTNVKYAYQKKVATLAAKLSKLNTELSQSEIWCKAHQAVKSIACELVEVISTKSVKTMRVVAKNLTDIYTPSGTGKPKPEGLKLFAELAKHIVGKNPVISTYKFSVIA
jgi:hypothetical protein